MLHVSKGGGGELVFRWGASFLSEGCTPREGGGVGGIGFDGGFSKRLYRGASPHAPLPPTMGNPEGDT